MKIVISVLALAVVIGLVVVVAHLLGAHHAVGPALCPHGKC